MRMGKRGICICGLVEHPVGVLSFRNILQSTRYLFHLMNTFLLQIAWENPLFLFTDSTCMQNSIYTLIFIGIQDKSLANLCLVFVTSTYQMYWIWNIQITILSSICEKNRVPHHQLLQPSYFFKFLFLTSVVCIKCYECLTST